MNKVKQQSGFTVLYAVIIVSMVVAIGVGIFALSFRQTRLVRINSDISSARAVVDRTVECLMFNDISEGNVNEIDDIIECEGTESTAIASSRSGYDLDFEIGYTDGSCAIASVDLDYSGDRRVFARGFSRCSAGSPVEVDPLLREYVHEVIYTNASGYARGAVFGDTGLSSQHTIDVEAYDGRLFVADSLGDVAIYTLSDPEIPSLLSTYDAGTTIDEIYIDENYLYVAANVVHIVDISIPTSPVLENTINSGVLDVSAIDKYGDTLFIGNSQGGISSYDVSDPTSPSFLDSYDPTDVTINKIFVTDDHAYVCGIYSDMAVMDVSDPANMVEVDNYGAGGKCKEGMARKGEYVFAPWGTIGVKVIGITDPTSINQKNRLEPDEIVGSGGTSWPNVLDVSLAGDYLFVAAEQTFHVYDVIDPLEDVLIYEDDPFQSLGIEPYAVTSAGGHIYVADYNGGVLPYHPSDDILSTFDDK